MPTARTRALRALSLALLAPFVPASIAVTSAHAQAPPARIATKRWIVERWSGDQGLPQNTVSAIAQTPDGYLWLGTYGGLVRFDGVRFTRFTSQAQPALGSDRVISLDTGTDGTLWIATDRSLASFRDGVFRSWGDSAGRPPGRTNRMFVDESGVWVTTSTGGLGHLTPSGTFERFTDRGVPEGWAGDIVRDRSGNVWVHHSKAGLLLMRPGASRFERTAVHANGLTATSPNTLTRDGRPVFNTKSGPARWTGSALELLGVGAGALVRDHHGGYWSSDARGVWHVDSLGKAELVESSPDANIRLARVMLVDREGTLWLGTLIQGLVRYRPRVVQLYLRADGLAVEQVAAVFRDSRGRLWIGSSCGATTVMTGNTLTPRREPGCIHAMAETADGALWMGIYNGGLRRMGRDGAVSRVVGTQSRLPSPIVLALHADADTTVWIGTENGLAHYARGEFYNYSASAGLPSTEIHYVTRDRKGRLWVGTGGGLAIMDGGRFRSWTKTDGLPNNTVRAIHEDAEGVFWIGTYGGGLARFDGAHFTTISTAEGLYDNFVSAILEDREGNLWMSGNRGIFRANRADLNAFAAGRVSQVRSVGYGPSDGLLTPETNGGFQPSAWQDRDGHLWFATVRGLASIDPAVAAPNTAPPQVAIETFHVDGAAMPVRGNVTLPAGSRYLEITYTALTSVAPERLAFRYRLEGFDPDWVYANERRTAYYSAPRPGRYTFAVTAATREGTWNENPQRLSFDVRAPVYATAWFRTLAGLLAAGAIIALVGARVARAHERERLQREFTRQVLHGQEQERGRLAGELHDSLGQDLLIMKTRAGLALRAAELPGSLRADIAEIASVATLAMQHAREMSHDLRPHHLDNLGLAASLRDLAERASAAGNLLIEADVVDAESRIGPDQAIQLFRIVQESLNNIIKHARATSVTIALRAEGAGARLLVSDDGRGMDLSRERGFGLTGIQQRVHILGGTFALRSVLDAGTTIDVFVPPAAA
jgi:signal transduction histidine kinase